MRYVLSNIEWDAEEEVLDSGQLPSVKLIESDKTLKELREGLAADLLFDEYGFCVKSLTVGLAKDLKLFTVYIDRVERYGFPCNVLAKSQDDAINRVRSQDDHDEFVDLWNELQPSVNTEYQAEEATDYADRPEGPVV